MARITERQVNPLLEELRKNIPKPPDIDEIIKDLITIPKIHVAYLYYIEEGHVLLQKLCRLLSGTKPSYNYAGWEDFGIALGLDPLLIQNMKYSLKSEDPTSYVFLAYTQRDDANIEHILWTLYEIKRHDIILETKDLVKKACDTILMKKNVDHETPIIKPPVTPNCPFVLKNFSKLEEKPTKAKFVSEILQKSSLLVREAQINKNRYAKTILVTYCSDADNILKEIMVQLRIPRHNLRLGIVVLNEHRSRLNICPEQFIFECFSQVDYVFPIITPQYIQQITNNTMDFTLSSLENPDHKYVKYIYRLMSTHYLRNGCKNTKVRCLVPDSIADSILKHSIMDHSLFQIWVRIKEINSVINAILKLEI